MTNRHLHLTLLLSLTAALAACGGSSSSPDPVVVVPPAPPPPAAEKVTVTGFVTDMPIANATVVITVNGQTFTAPNPTGADGSFTVEIESDDPDALVRCDAVDPNGPARFSALLNNFAGLQDNSNSDGVAADVNITNVTTAQLLLAEALAADGSIDSLDELQDIAGQVDPDELLQLSAAIKVVVDEIQGVTLPPGFDDVQALAQAIVDGNTTFLDDIELINPGILDDAIDELVSDGFATVAFAANSVPGVYIDAEGDAIVVFYADGSGYFGEDEFSDSGQDGSDSEQLVEAVTWSVTDSGSLQIVFTESQDVDNVVMLNEASNVLTLYSTTDNGDGTAEEPGTFNVVRYGFDADGFDAASIPGSYRDQDPDDGDETEFTVFLTGGSGYDIDAATGAQDDFFTWQVNAAGELEITDDGEPDSGEIDVSDEREVVRLLQGSTAETLNLLAVEFEFDGDAVIEIDAFPIVYTAEIITGPMPDMANTALLEGKSYAWQYNNEMAISTFAANGVFAEVIQDFDEFDGPEFGEEEAEWFVDDNGVLFLTFVEEDGSAETDQATVISGLGAEQMVVRVQDDDVEGDVDLTLDRVVAFNADTLVGNWDVFEDGQLTSDTVTFSADGSGAYFEEGVLDDSFSWNVNAAGTLVVSLDEADGVTDVWTDNFHRLADSTADNVHVFVVFRLNGELINDADNLEGPPEVIVEVNLIKQP